MEVLQRKLNTDAAAIRRAKSYITRITAADESVAAEDLETRLENLSDAWREYQAKYGKLLKEANEQEYNDLSAAFEETEEEFLNAKSRLRRILRVAEQPLTPALSSITQETRSRASPEMSLPRINLPTFSRDIIEWMSFKDLFNSIIDRNDSYPTCKSCTT